MKFLYPMFLLLLLASNSLAQPSQMQVKVPLSRQLFHDNIDNSQKNICKLDGKADNKFNATKDEELNGQITFSIINKVDDLQNAIELDGELNVNNKIKFLRGLNELLVAFQSGYRYKQIQGIQLPDLIDAFKTAMQLEKQNQSIVPVIEANDFEVGDLLLKVFCFNTNVAVAYAKDVLLLKTCHRFPNKTMQILNKRPDLFFADSLIVLQAYKNPEEFYNYASSTNALSKKIQASNDSLVQTIAKIASLKTGRMLFPFLDDIYHNKKTFATIDTLIDDDKKYYSLLVQTQIEYASRLAKGDTPMVMKTLTAKLAVKTRETYINEINGLHDSSDVRRFRSINNLSVQDLYYTAVMGEDEIYTSSFVNGVYPRLMSKLSKTKSDSLFTVVNNDHFKKWIKMCANFNLLDDYLKKMDSTTSSNIMKNFVAGLDKTDNLEDAVDVADSYASITNPSLRQLILDEVQSNYKQASIDSLSRGKVVYDILNNIFLSKDTANKIDLSAKYGIPAIYTVPNKRLQDTSGRIVIQQYIYGDKIGVGSFNSFLKMFPATLWKTVSKPEWVEISSKKGTPVTIYCNKPLADSLGLDEKARQNLDKYFRAKDINPTVVIFRGHSYNVKPDIKTLVPSAKIVLLGSCGGYHSISEALDICPEAHIIANKQVVSGTVNTPIIEAIIYTLQKGKDIYWQTMWKEIAAQLKTNPRLADSFEDFVPPYKNLGAIFITAYTKVND